MKSAKPILLGLLGTALLALYVGLRVDRERRLLAESIELRRSSTIQGWRDSWRDFVLETANARGFAETYVLTYDRTGTKLRTPFFPAGQPSLDWARYRAAVARRDTLATRRFLEEALAHHGTWDRVLALDSWDKQAPGAAPGGPLSPYESSLRDPEAKAAYAQLFRFFEDPRDRSTASRRWAFDQVLYRLNERGDIDAFVPSIRELKARYLPLFLAAHRIQGAQLDGDPWAPVFDAQLEPSATRPLGDLGLLAGALLAFGLGVALFLREQGAQRQALTRKVGFLNQIVHELKTPLAGLKLHVQLMQRLGPTAGSLRATEESVGRLDRLIGDLTLVYRSADAGEARALAAEELRALVAATLAEHGLATELGAGGVLLAVLAEPARLRIVLRNLVVNALRYGTEVRVELRETPLQTLILVKDDGPGVRRTERRKIFQEFYRGRGASTRAPDGLGLGLAIASRLAAEMGAVLRLDNPGEAGAVFSVALRRAPDQEG